MFILNNHGQELCVFMHTVVTKVMRSGNDTKHCRYSDTKMHVEEIPSKCTA